jgi:hypothetical protein
VHFCSAPQTRFWGKSEAEKSEAILSARQHRPEGQNPIALPASRKNAAQAWLASEHDPKKRAPVFRPREAAAMLVVSFVASAREGSFEKITQKNPA